MKVLEVGSLHSSIDEILDKIGTQKEQMNQIKEAVTNLIALEDSLKGAGGNAIRGFYEECHKPFLLFYENFLVEYEQTLNTIKSSLTGLEPSNSGFIRQSFLEQELNNGLNDAKSVTMELTDEANGVMDSVSDIVSLPHLQDQSFLESAEEAKKEKDLTIERLLEFDLQQTKNLDTVEQDIESMNQYITHIASLFKSGDLQVEDYRTGQLAENLSCFNTTGLNKLLSYGQPVQISSDKMMINGKEMKLPQLEQQEYGKEVEGSGGIQEVVSNVLDFVPIASNIKGGVEALFGKDFITGREIGDVERGILAAAIVGGPLVKAGVKAGKWGMKGIKWINAHYGDDVVKGMMKVKNALHPDRVKAVAKNATDLISHTISQVKDFTKGIGKKIRDYELPGFELVTNNGVKLTDNKTVGEVVDGAKESILRLAKNVESAVVGKVEGKNGPGGKGTDKLNSTKDIYKVSPKDVQQALQGYEQTHKFTAHFRGFEVKAQRSLSHMSDKQLLYSFKKGYSPKDGANDTIVLHHHEQKVEGPIIEMPSRYHDLGNKRQHPFGNSGGVGSGEARLEFNKWRKEYWKARYANEMIKRGIIE